MSEENLRNTLTVILAGGQGERLYPLTKDRAKPAVPFGGVYRIIDFTLSNCLHSGLRKIEILTQYRSHSLNWHLRLAWNLFDYSLGEYINNNPPQQRLRQTWYQGTADAMYQNLFILQNSKPNFVLILSGDHIYCMDYREMLNFHIKNKADLTVGAVEIERVNASPFGVIEKDASERVIGFQEKPANPKPIPEDPSRAIISMGIYVFNTEILVRRVIEDAKSDTGHDFGRNVIPAMIKRKDRVYVYSFKSPSGGFAYWRDIGALDAYWQANMDLLKNPPSLDLYDENWPIRSYFRQLPPAKISNIHSIENSLVSNGCVIQSAKISNSILSHGVMVDKDAEITDSIIMDNVKIEAGVKIHKAIIDKNVIIPAKTTIGFSPKKDARHFTVTAEGICVIPKDTPLLRN